MGQVSAPQMNDRPNRKAPRAASTITQESKGYPICPSCGATRPIRSLLVCRTCWKLLPPELQRAAYLARKEQPKSVFIGDLAVRVLASVAERKQWESKASSSSSSSSS